MADSPLKLMFARFPGGGMDAADVTDWLVGAVIAAKSEPRISEVLNFRITDTPITMGRNACIEAAKKSGVDFLVMVDNDMKPDAYLPANPHKLLPDPTARPFFESSFEFAYQQRKLGKPCIIGAPYCGPPPFENVYVFQWSDWETGEPTDTADIRLEQFTREEAAKLHGIQQVAALPTGLIIIDMQAIPHTDPPYFYYEWEDETESKKASTEDVTFTRDLGLNGVPQFCNWDAWCGHWKKKCVGRPILHSSQSLNARFRKRVLQEFNINPGEELRIIGNGHGRRHGLGSAARNGAPAETAAAQ